jgi:hypothetical protein
MTKNQEASMDADTPILDLDRYKDRWNHGDMTVYLTWNLITGRGCLVIVPRYLNPEYNRVRPCMVELDDAYLWAEETGDGAYAARMTYEFARWLGISQFSVRDLVRLTSMVREHLGDLLMCPPMPQSEKQVLADVLMTNTDTGRSVESTVVDYV